MCRIQLWRAEIVFYSINRNETNEEKPRRRGVCITPCQRGRRSGGRDFPGKLRGRPEEGMQKVASEPGI